MMDVLRRKGFSLVEVLVSLAVLSIGIMGLAGLQGMSVMSSNRAHLQTEAVLLAQEMMNRMGANLEEARSNNYSIAKQQFPSGSQNCSASCSPQQLVTYDLLQWKCALGAYDSEAYCQNANIKGSLPNGDGEVVADDEQITVTIYWSGSSRNNLADQSISLAMRK